MKLFEKSLAVIAGVAFLASTSSVSALTLSVGDSYYLGYFNLNGNPTAEAGAVQALINVTTAGAYAGGERSGNYLPPPALPDVVVDGFTKYEPILPEGSDKTVDVTGYLYLLGKFDSNNAGSAVWYVGDLSGMVTVPATTELWQQSLSHVTLFNPGNSVPDGGATAMLLGMALSGLAILRRRVA